MKKKKYPYCLVTILLCTTLFCTGCSEKKHALMDYRVDATPIQSSYMTAEEPYLSEGLCVIAKGEQTKEIDYVMDSKASLIINDTDGKMVFGKNIYKKVYPASITKIVTAYVVLKYGNLEDIVTVSYNASHITEYGATLCGLAEGDQIVLKDLLYSFLICSGNDAGIAIAEHISGSVEAFADIMNREMQELGAVHSHFVNPHGLHDDDHYTTAYDLYLIFHQLVQNEQFMDIVGQSGFTAKFQDKDGNEKELSFVSTDRYLTGRMTAPSGVTVLGGKTGTTFKAGSCLILYSKNENGKYYISVVLKAPWAESLYTQQNHLMAMEGQE